jgi:hypothetical protein
MADYTRDIGGNTTMLIRDTGGNVEFWIRTGASTWNNEQQWSFHANGGESGIRKFRMLRGGNWQKFGEVHVGYDQSVRFTIYNSGLGFPTYDFWQHIARSTVPGAPHIHQTYAISSAYIHVEFVGTHDGGSPVVEWQLGYGGNPNGPEAYGGSGGISDIGPFNPGTRVYFWARGLNAVGWSPWSNRTEATTWRVPDAPNPISFTAVTQKTTRTSFVDNFNGGTTVVERQIGYGKDPNTPVSFAAVDSSGINTIGNLDPGRVYYFWGRSRNSVGWGAWSQRSQLTLIAGSRIFTGNQWRRAVPYVKVNGVWKVVRPWVRNAGIWKETSL